MTKENKDQIKETIKFLQSLLDDGKDIEIGDEIVAVTGEAELPVLPSKFVVTCRSFDYFSGINSQGEVFFIDGPRQMKKYRKTGRHFNVETLLKAFE